MSIKAYSNICLQTVNKLFMIFTILFQLNKWYNA
jgi:hypothetical protein